MDFGMPFMLETQSVEDAAELCRSLGLDFVELNCNFPACQGLDASELKRIAKQYGVYFTLHVDEECDPFSFQPLVRQAWRVVLKQYMALAKEAGIPVLNMHLPHGVYITLPDRKAVLYMQYFKAYMDAVASFRAMCVQELEGSEVRICIENTNGFYSNELTALEYLLESPVFGLTLDIGHSHGAGDKDISFYRAHSDRVIHMHGHDALGRRDHLALGEGEIDLKERFAWAARNGARIVLETKTMEALKESVFRLAKYLPEC